MAGTKVSFYGITRRGKVEYEFGGINGNIKGRFYTESIQNGIVKVELSNSNEELNLNEFVTMVAGCLSKQSNFLKELKYAYGEIAYTVKSIELDFNGASIIIDRNNFDSVDSICEELREKI